MSGQSHHPTMSGFGRTLAGSIALHAVAIAAAAFLFASGANRVFITPVYTVDIVSNGPKQAVLAPPAPPAPPVEKTPEAAPEPRRPLRKPRLRKRPRQLLRR